MDKSHNVMENQKESNRRMYQNTLNISQGIAYAPETD